MIAPSTIYGPVTTARILSNTPYNKGLVGRFFSLAEFAVLKAEIAHDLYPDDLEVQWAALISEVVNVYGEEYADVIHDRFGVDNIGRSAKSLEIQNRAEATVAEELGSEYDLPRKLEVVLHSHLLDTSFPELPEKAFLKFMEKISELSVSRCESFRMETELYQARKQGSENEQSQSSL